jgi:type II secretory pathway component GspD/PulD (secretin)
VAIVPGGSQTNTFGDDLIPAGGLINFRGVDLAQVFIVYSELVNRTVLRPATLPGPPIWLTTQTTLTRREAIQALDAVLALNGVTMINIGDKFVKAVPSATANTEGGPFNKLGAGQLPELGPFVTHVVQLKYAKPSEVQPALQGFAKNPNAILPVDSNQILVLRDFTENVKTDVGIVKEIDVNVPSEFRFGVIPIKYALASEIANASTALAPAEAEPLLVARAGRLAASAAAAGSSWRRQHLWRKPYGQQQQVRVVVRADTVADTVEAMGVAVYGGGGYGVNQFGAATPAVAQPGAAAGTRRQLHRPAPQHHQQSGDSGRHPSAWTNRRSSRTNEPIRC